MSRAEYVTTLEKADVGAHSHIIRPDCFCCGSKRRYWIADVLGVVQACDVGKKLYRVRSDADDRWVLQVENDAQRASRISICGAVAPQPGKGG